MGCVRGWRSAPMAVLLFITFGGNAWAQDRPPAGADLQPTNGVTFVLDTFDRYPIVAITDMPGCEELHQFLRTLVQAPAFRSKVHTVVVDFGNPLLQPVIDRYVLDGKLVPASVLRRVWDDTTESPNLTWDSPVYAQFFDAVRTINLLTPKEQRIRVVLGDAPIVWRNVQTRQQWLAFAGPGREEALAGKLTEVLTHEQRALVIAAPSHLLRNRTDIVNARALIERVHPGQIFTVMPQTRLGPGDLYKRIEAREGQVPLASIAAVRDTWLGSLPLTSEAGSLHVEDATNAILYLGETRYLSKIQPSAQQFRDDEFWKALNQRWRVVHGEAFDLTKAGFDSRGPFDPQAPRTPAVLPPPPPDLQPVDAVDFVLKKLDEYPMVGLGDQHTCLEFLEFLTRLFKDARLLGKVQDIVIEAGNPLYQEVIDRYVVEGKSVPRSDRKPAWQFAAMGWYEANSPVYEEFLDLIRSVNLMLPKGKRIRVILGDYPLDVHELRSNPDRYLHPFIEYKETLQDPREISLAATVKRVLASGHRAIIICGNGNLKLMGCAGNARHIWEPAFPGQFYLIDQNGPGYPGWPAPSIVVSPDDPEPGHATLWLGPWDSRTLVRPSPLVYRDTDYWALINLLEETQGRYPLDLTERPFQYRGRYFQAD
jgi:hypothetical protein